MANETKITEVVAESAAKQVVELNSKLQELKRIYTDTAKSIGEGLKINPGNLSELNSMSELYNENVKNLQSTIIEYNKVAKDQQDLLKMLQKSQKEYNSSAVESATVNKLNKEELLAETKAQTEKLRQQKLINQENKNYKATTEELNQILKTQVKSIAEAEEQNRKLRFAVKNVSDEDANAAKIRSDFNKKIDENTKYIKQNRDAYTQQKMTIGDYKNQILDALKSQGTFNDRIKNTINIIKQQKGAIMLAAGAFAAYKVASLAISGVRQFVSDAVTTIKDFEKANSVLASILGTTSKDIQALTNDAKRLGETTSATASQVTELQTELAKLGFSREEILASTGAVLNFALATGSTLADAASLAGAALRIFGADAEEMDRYVSAMAVSTNKSALSFSKLATAIPIVAPVAKAFGFEIEDVLTLLGKLSDAGFDASMAATATRNIFLNLADSGGKLAKALGRPVKNLDELQAGLIALRDRGIDLNEMLDLTDKRSVAAFARFVQGADDLTKFRDSITDVNDELKKAAEERVNNLSGSLTKLSSAWEGLMLTFSGSSGVLKDVVDWLTKMVGVVRELISTNQENSDRLVEQSKKEVVERAKAHKAEEEYYRDIQGLKDGYIKQGLEESEAERKATSSVLSYVKERYEKQLALANDYKHKNIKLQKDRENASLFKQGLGLEMTDEEYRKEIDKTFNLYKTAISGAEEYKYVLEKLNKYIASSNEITPSESTYKTDQQIKEEEKAAKERLKIQQAFQQSSIDAMDEGYAKERAQLVFNLQKKIDAVKGYSKEEIETRKNLSIQMSKELEKFDREYELKRQTADITNRLSAAEKGSQEELKARIDILKLQRDKELKEAEKTSQDKLAIEEKYNKLIGDEYNTYARNLFKQEQTQNEILNTQRQIQLNEELAQLEAQQAKGLISKRDYEQKKSDIEFEFAKETIQNEIDLIEANLDLFSGDDRLNMEKKIAELRLKLSKEVTDHEIENDKKTLKSREEVEKAKVKLIQEAANAIGDIGNSLFERQINNIDAEIDANETEYDEQVSRIDALAEKEIITKEEAEARKRAAEEATAAKNKELEKKKAELQTRQARFQKTIDIGQTIANTAIAVMKAWSQGGIFAAPLAAMIAAIGAIQLATIVAQPIPKYAKGTDNHPGGLAVVGDGGKHEAVIHNGKAFITPDTPTLMSLPKGVEVIPDIRCKEFYDRFMDNSYYLSHNDAGEPVKIVNNFDVRGLEKGNKEIQKEIRNLTKTIGRSRRGDSFEAYKRRQI